VAFPAYPRSTIQQAGLFDEEMVRNQDDEYNYRLLKLGEKLLLSPDVRSRYYSRSSLKSLWRQYYQYGYWKVRVMQKHPRQLRLRQFIPFLFVTSLLFTSVLALVAQEAWILFGLLVGAYLTSNLLASVLVSARQGWKYLPMLPIAFTILHVAYGLGFLVGLVKFVNRWKSGTYKRA
jgi:succinoglycan biosynthesis protein ExoA